MNNKSEQEYDKIIDKFKELMQKEIDIEVEAASLSMAYFEGELTEYKYKEMIKSLQREFFIQSDNNIKRLKNGS